MAHETIPHDTGERIEGALADLNYLSRLDLDEPEALPVVERVQRTIADIHAAMAPTEVHRNDVLLAEYGRSLLDDVERAHQLASVIATTAAAIRATIAVPEAEVPFTETVAGEDALKVREKLILEAGGLVEILDTFPALDWYSGWKVSGQVVADLERAGRWLIAARCLIHRAASLEVRT